MAPPSSPRFALHLLGPPRWLDAEREQALPSRRALALLACLALDGRSSRAALAALLWPAHDEPSARRNLRRELARLREAGCAEAFVAGDDVLTLAPTVATDVAAFDAALAGDDLETALASWRGALLEGFVLDDAPAFEAWLAERRAAQQRRWREAAAGAASRRAKAGDLRGALALHLALVADDPLQELHYADAMRCHEALGERAAALDLYERCCRLLRDELGLEPLAASRALAERIRTTDRIAGLVLRPQDAAWNRLDAPLVGRDALCARLRASAAPLVLLVGEPGVGKTRLAQETLAAPRTLALACESSAQQAALHPVRAAIDAALRGRAERLNDLAPSDRFEAARLVSALDPHDLPGAPGAPAVDGEAAAPGGAGEAARQRFFDALAEVLDRLAGGAAGTLWIDDLHWADDATLALLAHLVHRRARAPARHVRVVAAARRNEIDARPALRELLRGLERAGLLERLFVAPLAPEHTLELVRALAGSGGGERFAARLQRATAGNPFFVLETIRFLFDAGELRLTDEGAWATRYDEATADYAELPVPPTVAATVLERVERLGAAARRVLEAGALAGAGFALAEVQPATALSDFEALDGLERAVAAELLIARDERYRFTHDLVREALAAALRPERRRLIHARLAQALATQRGRAERIAAHWQEAGRPAEALPWHLAAARDAARLFAWRDALAHTERALAALPTPAEGGDALARVPLLREQLEHARRAFDLDAMERAAADLAALAQDAARDDWRVEALVAAAEAAQLRRRAADAHAHAAAALARPAFAAQPPALQLRGHLALANALLTAGRIDEAEATLGAALALRAALAPAELALVLRGQANAARMREQHARAEPLLREAITLLAAPDDLEARLQAENLLGHALYGQGRLAEAIAVMEGALDAAERAQLTVVLRAVLPNLCNLCTLSGDYERGERLLQRGIAALRGVTDPASRGTLELRAADFAAARGDLGAALTRAGEAIALFEAAGGGSQDFAPWLLRSNIHAAALDTAGAVAALAALRTSPAFPDAPGPRALLRLRLVAAALPDDPEAAAAELATLRTPEDGAYEPELADYWRAVALLAAGHAGAARALAESLPEGDVGLYLRPVAVLALRLEIALALRAEGGENGVGRAGDAGAAVPAALIDAAFAAWPTAGALERLALGAPLVSALRARGEVARADALAAELRALVERMAASLHAEPTLAAGLRRRWPFAAG